MSLSRLRLVDLIALKAAGETVMKWLPKSKMSRSSVKKLEEALRRAKKLIENTK